MDNGKRGESAPDPEQEPEEQDTDRLKPLSSHPLSMEETLKKILDAGKMPETEGNSD